MSVKRSDLEWSDVGRDGPNLCVGCIAMLALALVVGGALTAVWVVVRILAAIGGGL
jgi:hypothetical protein